MHQTVSTTLIVSFCSRLFLLTSPWAPLWRLIVSLTPRGLHWLAMYSDCLVWHNDPSLFLISLPSWFNCPNSPPSPFRRLLSHGLCSLQERRSIRRGLTLSLRSPQSDRQRCFRQGSSSFLLTSPRTPHPPAPRFASLNTKRARNFMRSSTWTSNSASNRRLLPTSSRNDDCLRRCGAPSNTAFLFVDLCLGRQPLLGQPSLCFPG